MNILLPWVIVYYRDEAVIRWHIEHYAKSVWKLEQPGVGVHWQSVTGDLESTQLLEWAQTEIFLSYSFYSTVTQWSCVEKLCDDQDV